MDQIQLTAIVLVTAELVHGSWQLRRGDGSRRLTMLVCSRGVSLFSALLLLAVFGDGKTTWSLVQSGRGSVVHLSNLVVCVLGGVYLIANWLSYRTSY